MKNFIPVIGLEIHIELQTKSKMFCRCEAQYFAKDPNVNVCPVCLGLPGALPVPNKKAIEWTVLIGKALNCNINSISKFDRKHYFYPDLPKGFQISQYEQPIAVNGSLEKFRIHRVHLEEDTAKLIHLGDDTLIDFNRSGVPLVEIVTEPDFQSSEEVKKLLEELQVLIRYLDVSDADMEKGSMRLEPNVSLRKFSTISNKTLPNYKVEVKNINSFRFVKQAIDYEVKRQSEILERGGNPVQETRGYDEEKGETYSQRTKEQAHDYRYFPEPDIPPLVFDRSYLEEIERNLPMLPHQLVEKFEKNYRIRHQDAYLLTRDRKTAEYYEKVMKETKLSGQAVANLLINKKISQEFSPDEFTRKALELLSPRETDSKVLEEAVKKVLKTNEKAVDDYKKGKPNAVMFLVGQVMREMKGKADARIVREKLIEKLT